MLFVDLDGTILDDRRRHYAAYEATLKQPDVKGIPIPEKEYWFWKQNQGGVDDLLKRSKLFPTKYKTYKERFPLLLESPDFLDLDVLRSGSETFLSRMFTKTPIVLVTQRRDGDALMGQLGLLGIQKYFVTVLFGAPEGPRALDSKQRGRHKAERVKARYRLPPTDSIWLGDTETDREAARIMGYRSVLVEGGHRSKTRLLRCEPERIVTDLAEVLSELLPGGRWQR